MKLKVYQKFNIYFYRNYKFFLLPFIILFFFNLIEHNDSISYIDNYSRRPFLYPSIIDFFEFLSPLNFKIFLKVFQIIFGAFSIIFFLKFFNKKFKPENFILYLTYIILIIPFFNFSMPLANSILSESIAYPIFLIFLVYLFNFIFEKFSEINFLKLLFFIFLLVSCRSQFYFIFPLLLFLIIIKFYKNKKNLLYFILKLFLLYVIINLSQLTYNKINFSYFSNINIASFQFIAISHFVSNSENFEKINSYPQKEIINTVNEYLINSHNYEIKKSNNNETKIENNFISIIKNLRKNYNEYYHFYVPIIHAYEYELPKKIILSENEIENINKLNSEVFKIAINLISQSPKEYFFLYLSSVTFGAGGYFLEAENFKGLFMNLGFSGTYLFLIHIFILLFYSFKIYTKKKLFTNEAYLLFSTFFNICNICFICFFEPPYDRYIFYTNIIFLIFLINKIFDTRNLRIN